MGGRPLLIAVVGTKKYGKTAIVEYLISGLTKRGFNVAAIKHVHHAHFTIDSEGKDSWRFTKAGARHVAIVSPEETAIIEKTKQGESHLNRVIDLLREKGPDIIILEGFKSILGKLPIHKIVTAHNLTELEEMKRDIEGLILGYNLVDVEGIEEVDSVPIIDLEDRGSALLDAITRLTVVIH